MRRGTKPITSRSWSCGALWQLNNHQSKIMQLPFKYRHISSSKPSFQSILWLVTVPTYSVRVLLCPCRSSTFSLIIWLSPTDWFVCSSCLCRNDICNCDRSQVDTTTLLPTHAWTGQTLLRACTLDHQSLLVQRTHIPYGSASKSILQCSKQWPKHTGNAGFLSSWRCLLFL